MLIETSKAEKPLENSFLRSNLECGGPAPLLGPIGRFSPFIRISSIPPTSKLSCIICRPESATGPPLAKNFLTRVFGSAYSSRRS